MEMESVEEDIDDVEYELMEAAKQPAASKDIVRLCMKIGEMMEPDAAKRIWGRAICDAAKRGRMDNLETMLALDAEAMLTAGDELSANALQACVRRGHVDCMATLLKHMPETQVLARDERGNTALHMVFTCYGELDQGRASRTSRRLAMLELLLTHAASAQLEAVNVGGRTALMEAARASDDACMQRLLEHDPKPQLKTDEHGWTALEYAIHTNIHVCRGKVTGTPCAFRCVHLLLAHNAPMFGADPYYQEILQAIVADLAAKAIV